MELNSGICVQIQLFNNQDDRQEKAHRMMLWMVCTYRARAIKYRQENNEAVGGFFSQIGDLYVVHHLWGKWKEA